jgi:N-carbamoylputrescine amidase
MCGHAAANVIPVLAANRIGRETDDGVTLDFYGTSFCADHRANIVSDAGRENEAVMLATLDLDCAAKDRRQWGTFQTRQPQHYRLLIERPAGPPPH